MGCQPFHPLPFPRDQAVARRLLGCAIRAGVPGLQTPLLPVTELKGGGSGCAAGGTARRSCPDRGVGVTRTAQSGTVGVPPEQGSHSCARTGQESALLGIPWQPGAAIPQPRASCSWDMGAGEGHEASPLVLPCSGKHFVLVQTPPWSDISSLYPRFYISWV